MLKHGRAGVPMEVMGLMLGEFVDEYTGDFFFILMDSTQGLIQHVQPDSKLNVCFLFSESY